MGLYCLQKGENRLSNSDVVNSLVYSFESKYLYFQMANKHNPASWIVDVIADDGDVKLGQIRYYAHWRQYAFYPEDGTVYEKTCLTEITKFVVMMNDVQKKGLKPEDPQKKLEIK